MLSPLNTPQTAQGRAAQELDAWLDGLPDIHADEALSPQRHAPASPVPWLEGLFDEVNLAQSPEVLNIAAPSSPTSPVATGVSSGAAASSAFQRSGAPSPEPPAKRRRTATPPGVPLSIDTNDIATSSRAVGMAAHLHMLQARLLGLLGYEDGRQHVLISASTLRYIIDVAFFNGVDACLSSCPRCNNA